MKTWLAILSVALIASILGTVAVAQMSAAKGGKTSPAVKRNATKRNSRLDSHSHPARSAYMPVLSPDQMRVANERMGRIDKSVGLAEAGDASVKRGDLQQAEADYQQAMNLWADNSRALYGMGQCADVAGDKASAVQYYRTATYADNSPHTKWNTQTNDPARLMEFTLLLSKAGQEQEALSVYRRAAGLLNYMDGKQHLDVLLPDFGPGGWPYTPQRMRAMAYVGHAHDREGFDKKLAAAELEKAIALAPDSPVPYFYKGRRLVGKGGRSREMLAAFRMAAQLGDDDTKAAVDKKLKDYSIESAAKAEQDMEDLQKKQAAQKN